LVGKLVFATVPNAKGEGLAVNEVPPGLTTKATPIEPEVPLVPEFGIAYNCPE
jgi:hypothetical protein